MAIEARVVKVVDVQTGIDMRVTRSFLDEKECQRLKPGQCIVRVNTRRNMMRIYMGGDQFIEPGMITAWCRAGRKWNREMISNWMRNGANVELDGIIDGAQRVQEKRIAANRRAPRLKKVA